MPGHKPLKFESLDQNVVNRIKSIISENKTAKTVLNATLAIMTTGGIIALGVTAPNALFEINKLNQKEKRKRKNTEKFGIDFICSKKEAIWNL